MTGSAEGHLRLAAKKAREWTEERNDGIRLLRGAGYSLRSLAEITGLSHTAIAKICDRA